MIVSEYTPALLFQARVRFIGKDHQQSGQYAVVVRILENPSKKARNQWYDVRFDDGTYGRFLERDLEQATR
jgi:hypothetical protein